MATPKIRDFEVGGGDKRGMGPYGVFSRGSRKFKAQESSSNLDAVPDLPKLVALRRQRCRSGQCGGGLWLWRRCDWHEGPKHSAQVLGGSSQYMRFGLFDRAPTARDGLSWPALAVFDGIGRAIKLSPTMKNVLAGVPPAMNDFHKSAKVFASTIHGRSQGLT